MEEKKQNRNEYTTAYKKEHLKRIPLEISLKDYETIKNIITVPMNTYIKKALQNQLKSDFNIDLKL